MLSVLHTYLQNNTAFYAYKDPTNDNVHIDTIDETIPFEFDDLTNHIKRDAFAMYPFDHTSRKGWYFTADKQQVFFNKTANIETTASETKQSHHFNEEQFKEYGKQFDKMMKAIKSKCVQKVILSKPVVIRENFEKNLPEIFIKLIALYPKTFVFLVSSPETGIWMGASPELLFSKVGDKCTTVSLAGTRSKFDDISLWTDKEMEEQSMVSDFIDDALAKHSIKQYKKTGPSMLKVGNLTHLKTIYHFKSPSDFQWGRFVKSLHPTPALCGEPKMEAMELIRKVETHNREYYGGFLGPVHRNSTHLYVNLRSMKIEKNKSTIYVGGGLTHQSNLQNEWDELKLKSKTLLSAL